MTLNKYIDACETCGFAGKEGCPRRNTKCPRYVHPLTPEFERVKEINAQLKVLCPDVFINLEVGPNNKAKHIVVYGSKLLNRDNLPRLGTLRPEASLEEVIALRQGYNNGLTVGAIGGAEGIRHKIAELFGFVTREEFEEGRNHD